MLTKIDINDMSPADQQLIQQAREATTRSWAPYSHFHVGAAVKLIDGKVILGANQENASYPVGICAERSTLATAQNIYPGQPVIALALAATDKEGNPSSQPVTPCGMCRQAIAEVQMRYHTPIRIIMAGTKQALVAQQIEDLLPAAFQ